MATHPGGGGQAEGGIKVDVGVSVKEEVAVAVRVGLPGMRNWVVTGELVIVKDDAGCWAISNPLSESESKRLPARIALKSTAMEKPNSIERQPLITLLLSHLDPQQSKKSLVLER
jgi:hypothetical protein